MPTPAPRRRRFAEPLDWAVLASVLLHGLLLALRFGDAGSGETRPATTLPPPILTLLPPAAEPTPDIPAAPRPDSATPLPPGEFAITLVHPSPVATSIDAPLTPPEGKRAVRKRAKAARMTAKQGSWQVAKVDRPGSRPPPDMADAPVANENIEAPTDHEPAKAAPANTDVVEPAPDTVIARTTVDNQSGDSADKAAAARLIAHQQAEAAAQAEQAKLAAERAAAEQQRIEQARIESVRKAAEQAALQQALALKAEQQRQAADTQAKAEQARQQADEAAKQAQQRLAAEAKAQADAQARKLAEQKQEAERQRADTLKAEQQRQAAEALAKAELAKQAAEAAKAEQLRLAAEAKAQAEAQARKLAEQKLEAERQRAEALRIEQQRVAADAQAKAEQARAAADAIARKQAEDAARAEQQRRADAAARDALAAAGFGAGGNTSGNGGRGNGGTGSGGVGSGPGIALPINPPAGLSLAEQAMQQLRNGGASTRRSEDRLPHSRTAKLSQPATAADIEFRFYAESWRLKVQRVGSFNSPHLPPGTLVNPMVVSVVVNSDGSLASVVIVQSSGDKRVDDAARRIVVSSAPFSPFPPGMAQRYDQVEITRTWNFNGSETSLTY